jgi:hypothetical protein
LVVRSILLGLRLLGGCCETVTTRDVRLESVKRAEADINQIAITLAAWHIGSLATLVGAILT